MTDKISVEEVKLKLVKLRDELDEYYNNVFIPEYQDNTVFDTHRVDSPEVFDLVVRKKLSENKEILNEERQYWVNDDEIHSVDDLPSFQGLLEFEKQVPDSISQLNDDEIDQLINSLDSIQLTEWQNNSFCGFHGVGFFGVSSFDHFDCFIEIRSTNTIIPKVEIPKVKANTVNALSWEPQKTFANHPATNPSKKLTGITIIHAHQINHFGFIRISIRCFSQ